MSATGRRYGARTATERHDDRRGRLVEAALDTFGTTGYSSTSIEQLCARANVSTRSFYEHFANREELLIALHDEVNAEALQAVAQAVTAVDPDDFEARARAGVEAYFRVMTADRRRTRIALVESVGVSREAEAHRQEAIGRFADFLRLEAERLAADGVIPARDFSLSATGAVGAVNGLINTWTVDPDWDAHVDEVIAEAARLIVLAIRA